MEEQVERRLYEGIEKLGSKFDIFASTTSDRLTKIETMFTMFDKAQNNFSDKMDDVDKAANEALQSTKAAHKRLDEIKVPSQADHDALKARTDRHDKIIFWISTLIIGGVVLGVMAQVIQR